VDGPGSEILVETMSKALAKCGIVNVFVEHVSSSVMVPFMTSKFLDRVDGVIALDIVVKDEVGVGKGSVSSVLSAAVAKVAYAKSKPAIAGVICQSSLLEAKGVLPNLAYDWAAKILLELHEIANELVITDMDVSHCVPVKSFSSEESEASKLVRALKDILKV
jgi:6,7-dimethyl-8-ribityllumazine synthase